MTPDEAGDIGHASLVCRLNGEVMQSATLDDLAEHNRTAMRADLDDVLARIRMRSGEVGRHHLIAVHSRERGVSGDRSVLEPFSRSRRARWPSYQESR